MLDNHFDSDFLAEMKALLSECEITPISEHRELSGVWFMGEDTETELRLLKLINIRLTVSRVNLVRKRHGTMTAVLDLLKAYCIKNAVGEIVVQSVSTPEMAAWCVKNDFVPRPATSVECQGFIMGDYVLQIASGA